MEEIFYSSTYVRSTSKPHMNSWHIVESSYIHSSAFAKEHFLWFSVKREEIPEVIPVQESQWHSSTISQWKPIFRLFVYSTQCSQAPGDLCVVKMVHSVSYGEDPGLSRIPTASKQTAPLHWVLKTHAQDDSWLLTSMPRALSVYRLSITCSVWPLGKSGAGQGHSVLCISVCLSEDLHPG